MIPLGPLTVLFVGGVALGLALPLAPAWALTLAAAALALCAWLTPVRFTSLCAFCAVAGAGLGVLAADTTPPPVSRPGLVSAVVAADPVRGPRGCRVDVTGLWRQQDPGWRPGPRRAVLHLARPCPTLVPGHRVRFRARLWPGHRGHRWQARLSTRPVVVTGRKGRPPPALLAAARTRAVQHLAPWQDHGRALLAAVVAGDRSWLPRYRREQFRRTGTAHLLAISGLHVGLVAGLCFVGVRRLWGLVPPLAQRAAPARVAAWSTVALTWLFVAFSGGAAPALRAGVMATALLVAPLAGRQSHPWAALAAAALALLCYDPAQLATPGFQLSFAAVAGILLMTRAHRLKRPDPFEPDPPRWRQRLGSLLRITFAATAATLPLVAHHFGQATVAGLALNLLVVPLFAATVVPLGLVGTALALVHPFLGAPVIALASKAAALLAALVAWGDASLAPSLGFAWQPSGLETVCVYTIALGLAKIRRRAGQVLVIVALAVALLAALAGRLGPGGGSALRITFFDVGKGDAALVTLPDGRHLLVDAPGPTKSGYSATQSRLLPALHRRGVRRLHAFVASHAHDDHLGGAPAVLAALRVDRIWHNGSLGTAPEARDLRRVAALRGVPMSVAHHRRFGPVQFQLLAPRSRGQVHPHPLRTENDNSLVVRLVHPAGQLLLTGDLERSGEAALLARGPVARATVLKVGHHGSHTASSPAFLRAVAPRLAVISAPGARPGRPFPSPHVLSALRRAGARTAVTGVHGDVTVTFAPWGVSVRDRRGHFQLTPRGWREAPPWPSLRAVLRDPRVLLP